MGGRGGIIYKQFQLITIMQWRLEAYSTGTSKRRLTRINPEDGSWYSGEICRESIQPHGRGAYYTAEGKYIQGGQWENGILKTSISQEDYEY